MKIDDYSHNYAGSDSLIVEARFSVADQLGADRRARALAWQWIRENPGTFIALMPRKLFRFWAPDGEAEWAYQSGTEWYEAKQRWFRAVRITNQAFYVAVIALFFYAAVRLIKARASPRFMYGYAIAAFFTCLSLVFSGQSRYHFPIMPLIMIYAGWLMLGDPLLNRKERGVPRINNGTR